ncbi:uncharacterized protein LACBIDRAFT_326163 [Laccaria bicolor S238N-H82]|uniref:Predicted protein n=1 Tax=Laccaria bicolor (strain S238N-H82 / ATCC MYA-4686) TaxID=486041 RepID=B0D7I1_LACBS|nr:uncharacterized protein LACBIDRAFT_326163 [Laccaria bicolor S238N-H82]EDR09400.1 predicted protein [Laccaria bicolor S238N-H82]|eukprot:XP_001879749.1 predicted protein [Laccaria bicolor S238N-H82]
MLCAHLELSCLSIARHFPDSGTERIRCDSREFWCTADHFIFRGVGSAVTGLNLDFDQSRGPALAPPTRSKLSKFSSKSKDLYLFPITPASEMKLLNKYRIGIFISASHTKPTHLCCSAPGDTTNSMKYADRLTASKEANSLHPDDDIGAVEMYKTSVVLPFPLPNEFVPFWAVNLLASLNNLQASVNNLQASVNNLQASVNNLQASLNNLQATLHNVGLGQMQQITFVPQMGNELLLFTLADYLNFILLEHVLVSAAKVVGRLLERLTDNATKGVKTLESPS